MSHDAIALIGFVSLFALILLRVPVGMAMGLVGVTGYATIVGAPGAQRWSGSTSMRTVTDYTFGVIPMFMLMGAIVAQSGMSAELFRAANAHDRALARRPRPRHHRGLRGLRRDLRLLGRDRRDFRHRRLSGDAGAPLPEIVLHRRDRRRRHAGRDLPALDGAGGLRAHHPAGHRQAVHRRHPARRAGGGDVHGDDLRHRRASGPISCPPGGRASWRERGQALSKSLGARCCCSCS